MMNKIFNATLGLILLCIMSLSTDARAQLGVSNARSVGMGGAYTALARGVEAPAWNPANLAISSSKKYHFNLISVGIGFHNNSFSKKYYDLYNGQYLSDADKQDILSRIPAQGLRGDFDTEVQAMGFAVGHFAFTASGLATSDFVLSKDIVELILYGNEFERAYNIGDTDGEGWGISSYAVSAGFSFPTYLFKEFSVGASIKYLRGHAFGKVREAETTLITDIDGVHGNGRVVIDRALGGSGFALDLGSAARLDKNWTIGARISNVINFINWSSDTKRFTYVFTADSISVKQIDDTDIDSVFIDSDEEVDIESFTTTMPRQLRLGIARTMKNFVLAIDYIQGLQKAAGVSTTPKLAVGSELRLVPFFPVRGGLAVGGRSGFASSLGFSIDFSVFTWDFAVANKGGLFSGRGLGLAFDWMFRF